MNLFFLLPDIASIMTDMVNQIVKTVPNVITALVIFLVGFIISKLIASALDKTLRKIGVDKFSDKLNEIEMVNKANTDIKLSKVFSKAIFYFLLLFFSMAAAEALNMPAVSAVFKDLFDFFPKALVALLIIVLGLLFAEFLRKVLETAMKSLGIGSAVMISNFIFYFLFINIFIVALSQADINTDFLSQNLSLIIGGIVFAFALAYGIASKDVVANYIASFQAVKHLNTGDRVTIDGVQGVVTKLDKATVTIKTEDSIILLPLAKVMNEKIIKHN